MQPNKVIYGNQYRTAVDEIRNPSSHPILETYFQQIPTPFYQDYNRPKTNGARLVDYPKGTLEYVSIIIESAFQNYPYSIEVPEDASPGRSCHHPAENHFATELPKKSTTTPNTTCFSFTNAPSVWHCMIFFMHGRSV